MVPVCFVYVAQWKAFSLQDATTVKYNRVLFHDGTGNTIFHHELLQSAVRGGEPANVHTKKLDLLLWKRQKDIFWRDTDPKYFF